MYWVYWAPFILTYQVVNRWPIVDPIELPFTWADRLIPFVSALLPVYVAYIPFYWLTVWRSQSDVELNRIFYAAHLQLLISLPFFILLPVRMPRDLFYSPAVYGWTDAFWRWFDAPNNCFPSLHVSNCLLLAQFNWSRPRAWIFVPASLTIIASTVFVKQHYAVDLLGGGAVYLLSRWFLRRLEINSAAASTAECAVDSVGP
jgi:membrane-associated phospholipid phosphatase